MKRLALFFLLIYQIVIPYSEGISQSLPDIKEYAKSAPASIEKSPLELALYLTKNESSQKQQALNIYTWLIYNIRYDPKALTKISLKSFTPEQTLRRKKGVCYQYSDLFQVLCSHAGIRVKEVLGYTRGFGYTEGDLLYKADHSWNSVYLDSRWFLIDATWGSGHLVRKKQRIKELASRWFNKPFIGNRYRFEQKPNFGYFLCKPDSLIKDHLAADPNWQLLPYPISLKSFEHKDWKGYTGMLDPWEEKELSAKDYDQRLSPYKTISAIRYLGKTARITHQFNSKNTELLAIYYYNLAQVRSYNRLDPASGINTNKSSIKNYTSAISNASKFIQQAKISSQHNIKNIKGRVNLELMVPTRKRIASTQRDLRKHTLSLRNNVKVIGDQERETIKIQTALLQAKKVPTGKGRLLKKMDTLLISENKHQIQLGIKQIEIQLGFMQYLQEELNKLGREKLEIQSEIKRQNNYLNQLLKESIEAIQNKETLNQLSFDFHEIELLGAKRDQLQAECIDSDKEIMEKNHASKKALNVIIRQVQIIQKLQIKNCSLSNGKECGTLMLEKISSIRELSYLTRRQILEVLSTISQDDFEYFPAISQILAIQSKRLELSKRYILLYLDKSIEEKRFNEARNIDYTENMILQSNKEIKLLRKENAELNKLIRERKRQLSK